MPSAYEMYAINVMRLNSVVSDSYLSHCMRKQTIWGLDKVLHKPACAATEDGYRLEMSNLRRREIVLYSENKSAAVSYVVTAQLICAFIFVYADCWFSDAATYHTNDVNNVFIKPYSLLENLLRGETGVVSEHAMVSFFSVHLENLPTQYTVIHQLLVITPPVLGECGDSLGKKLGFNLLIVPIARENYPRFAVSP